MESHLTNRPDLSVKKALEPAQVTQAAFREPALPNALPEDFGLPNHSRCESLTGRTVGDRQSHMMDRRPAQALHA